MSFLLILFLLVLGGIAGYLLARYVIHPDAGSPGVGRNRPDATPDEPAKGASVVEALPATTSGASAGAGAPPEPPRENPPGDSPERTSTVDAVPDGGDADASQTHETVDAGAPPPEPEGPDDPSGVAPERLDRPDEADDLKRINGIGPSIERTLNELGIYRYAQIAAFTPDNIVWVDRHLPFRGRIEREEWVGQARALVTERQGPGPQPSQGGADPLH